MSKITNYVITHKAFDMPDVPSYQILQVGFNPDIQDSLRDNTGDNIALKNQNYCELTGLYWIWKNDHSSDFIGINHYRRFFTEKRYSKNWSDALREETAQQLLGSYDIILPYPVPYKETVAEQYCLESGFKKDLERVREIIKDKFPKDLDAFDQIMNAGKISQYNMMITSRLIYDEYSQWLFTILFELEKNLDLSSYNDYQKRIYGFLSERLLNVFVLARNLKIKYLPVAQSEISRIEDLRVAMRSVKNRALFTIRNKNE